MPRAADFQARSPGAPWATGHVAPCARTRGGLILYARRRARAILWSSLREIDTRMPQPPITSLADLRAARADLERRVEERQRELGPDDPALADDLRELGRLAHELRDLNDAAALLERARVLHSAAFGENHPEVATDLNHLGLVLHDAGDVEVAHAVLERALALDEQALG